MHPIDYFIIFIIISIVIQLVAIVIATESVKDELIDFKYKCRPEFTRFGNLVMFTLNRPLYYSILFWFYLLEYLSLFFSWLFVNKKGDTQC